MAWVGITSATTLAKMWDLIQDSTLAKTWQTGRINAKQKLLEFKEHKELKYKCENFIDTYFNEDCRAFTLKNKKCGNKISLDVSKDFCKAHDKKYVSKIIKIINRVLPLDISRLCANYLFH